MRAHSFVYGPAVIVVWPFIFVPLIQNTHHETIWFTRKQIAFHRCILLDSSVPLDIHAERINSKCRIRVPICSSSVLSSETVFTLSVLNRHSTLRSSVFININFLKNANRNYLSLRFICSLHILLSSLKTTQDYRRKRRKNGKKKRGGEGLMRDTINLR
jgi:hypothetical protein